MKTKASIAADNEAAKKFVEVTADLWRHCVGRQPSISVGSYL
jgi:hypothetical protein